MRRGVCKECGAVWSNRDEIVQATVEEHRKTTGHTLELE